MHKKGVAGIESIVHVLRNMRNFSQWMKTRECEGGVFIRKLIFNWQLFKAQGDADVRRETTSTSYIVFPSDMALTR